MEKQQILEILTNNYKEFTKKRKEGQLPGGICAGNIPTLSKIILKILPKMINNTCLFDFIGVKPMTGPVDQIQTILTTNTNSIISPFEFAKNYNNDMKYSTTDITIEVRSRRMAAIYTFETAQDAMASYGIDIEDELITALSTSLMTEIEQDILAMLDIKSQEYNYLAKSPDQLYKNVLEFINVELEKDHVQKSEIYCICSYDILKSLNDFIVFDDNYHFDEDKNNIIDGSYPVKYVGTIDDIKFYANPYSNPGKILMGSKANDIDAPMIYCPYNIVIPSGIIINPVTFEPICGFVTRYACYTPQNDRRIMSKLLVKF